MATRRSCPGLLAASLAAASLVLAPSVAATPREVLYDRYDNPNPNATSSQNFEDIWNPYDTELADDFVVPSGPGWNVEGVEVQGQYFARPGPAASVNVRVYADGTEQLPWDAC